VEITFEAQPSRAQLVAAIRHVRAHQFPVVRRWGAVGVMLGPAVLALFDAASSRRRGS
jgi:hypothetical protein